MKLWMKYSISVVLGLILALFMPEIEFITKSLTVIAETTLRLGRFIAFPLLFFTLTVSVCQLRRDGKLLSVFGRLALYAAGAALIYTALALLLSFILPADRIPILTDSSGWQSTIPFRNDGFHPEALEQLRLILPVNAFEIFSFKASYMIPALLFAFILGTQLFYDREEAEPVYNLFDSFSRMFYRLNTRLTEALPFLLFSIAFVSFRHISSISDLSAYFSIIRLVAVSTILVIFGVQPLLFFILSKKNPYREMRIFRAALISSFISGDNFFNVLVLVRTLKENGGMKRKVSGLSLPLLNLFSRPGTAMLSALGMLIILKSYSSLELTAFQVFWVTLISIAVSFTLYSQSYLSVYTALISSCALYGRGLEDGYVLMLPVLPVLVLAAGAVDAVNSAYLTLLFNDNKDFRSEEDPEDYI